MTDDLRKHRACMVCAYVQSFDAFRDLGCPNCESFLDLRRAPDRIFEATSSSFSGLVALLPRPGGDKVPAASWVGRWMRAENKRAGLYALRVVGRISEEVEELCAVRGVRPVSH